MTKTNHARLFKSLQYIRLQLSAACANRDIQQNEPVSLQGNEGFFKSLFTSIGNEFKSNKTNRVLTVQENIEAELARFITESTQNEIQSLYNLNEIKNVVETTFKDDTYALERTMFSISVILDGEYKYEYEEETLNSLSKILWDSPECLSNMKKGIEGIYRDLAKQPLSNNQKLLLGGTAAVVLLTAAVPALALGGLSASGITGGLASFGTAVGLGGAMVEGVGLMAIAELLLDGAIIGFTYAMLDNHNKNIVKKSFREMDYNNAARMLAIKCYIMHMAKRTMPESMFKEKISELLQMLQDLKSDTDYVLIVENQNIEDNIKKVKVFHNLDEKLAKMFC